MCSKARVDKEIFFYQYLDYGVFSVFWVAGLHSTRSHQALVFGQLLSPRGANFDVGI